MMNEELISALNWRYAVKKFDNSKKISEKDWDTLGQALVLSASSFGLQPWKFIVVQNPEIRKQLTPCSWGQTQIEDCSHLVAFCALKNVTKEYVQKHIDNMANIGNIDASVLDGYKNMMLSTMQNKTEQQILDWSSRQVYIALGNLLTSAAILKIDACPMEGIEPDKYNSILDTKDYSTVCVCALGYRSDEDKYSKSAKVRFDKKDIISFI